LPGSAPQPIPTPKPKPVPKGTPYSAIVKGVPITYYITDNGAAAIDFSQNDYGQVIIKNGMRELAQEIYDKAQSINPNSMSGRTVEGINTELQLHYLASQVLWEELLSSAEIANIGGIKQPGKDRNALFFESASTAKVVAQIMLDPKRYVDVLQEIAALYFK